MSGRRYQHVDPTSRGRSDPELEIEHVHQYQPTPEEGHGHAENPIELAAIIDHGVFAGSAPYADRNANGYGEQHATAPQFDAHRQAPLQIVQHQIAGAP